MANTSTALTTGGVGSGISSINGDANATQTLSVLVNGLETVTTSNGNHIANITTAALSNIAAVDVTVAAGGDLSSVNAQGALQELDAEINAIIDLATWFNNQIL